jgi:hypothetical protein
MDLKSFAETYWSIQEKKLDPVGKEDGDVDNDGDKDSSDSYLMKRRKAIAKAMKKEEIEKEETEVVEHHQKDANGKVIEHEDEAPGTPSSVEEEKTILEQLTENGEELDMFDAVVAYLIDEGFAESWEDAQKIMVTLKPELVEEVYQSQLNEILEKGTKGKVGFRSGMQGGKQVMKTDKVTVMHKGTKASGGTKARKRSQSPEGKAIGALMKHKSQQWKAEDKATKARKAGDKKTAAKQDAIANRAYDRRRKQSGTLFDKTGDFHDRADND